MASKCIVCRSTHKKKIDRLLLSKASYKSIVAKYKITYPSLKRHEREHLPRDIASNMVANMTELKVPDLEPLKELPQLDNLAGCISYVYNEFLGIHLRAKAKQDDKLNLLALKNIIDSINVIVKGKELEFNYRSQTSWNKVLPFIFQAVKNMPEARDAIFYAIDKAKTTIEGQDVL